MDITFDLYYNDENIGLKTMSCANEKAFCDH